MYSLSLHLAVGAIKRYARITSQRSRFCFLNVESYRGAKHLVVYRVYVKKRGMNEHALLSEVGH